MLIREREIHRYYGHESRNRRKHYPERRSRRPLARTLDTPLKLLVLVAIGAGIAHFIPSLLCVLLQFGTVLVMGLVVYWCWTLFRRP